MGVDAERRLLAELLAGSGELAAVRAVLQSRDFGDRRHERIFAAILRLVDSGRPAEQLLIAAELDRAGELHDAGGTEYIDGLCDGDPPIGLAPHYAHLVLDSAKRRGLRSLAADLVNRLDTTSVDPSEIAQDIVRRVSTLVDRSAPQGTRRLRTINIMAGPTPAPPQMLVERLVLDADVNLWAGSGGAGKSTLLFVLATCLCVGRPAFGLAVRRSGPVLLVIPEDGQHVARMALDAIVAGLELSSLERETLAERMHMIHDEETVNLLADVPSLRAAVENTRAIALIADPLTNLLGRHDENAPEVSTGICDALRREICRSTGAAVVLSHHLRKASKDADPASSTTVSDVRGGGGWSNGARLVIGVSKRKDSDEVTLEVLKSNRVRSDIRHELSLSIEAEADNEAHWRTVRVSDRNAGATSQTLTPGIGRAINDNERKALSVLDDRHEPGRHTSWSDWQKTAGLKPDTLKSIKRRLQDAGLVVAHEIGKRPNGGTRYDYALSETGRRALETGWLRDGTEVTA